MEKKYCGACRGERGCSDCQAMGSSVSYTGLTEFFVTDGNAKSGGCPELPNNRKKAYDAKELLLAADLGTTTLAFVCANAEGEVLASYGMENPQRKVAADVVGRIDAALYGQREKLTKEIKEALVKGFLFVLKQGENAMADRRTGSGVLSVRVAIAGNTVMSHILSGYPLEGLARAPFLPYTTEAKKSLFSELFEFEVIHTEMPEVLKNAAVTILPGLSAFVGGDAVAGMYALLRPRMKETSLLIDLGTNGELLLSTRGEITGTATAMGSAMEGGRYAYASELFRLIAEAIEQGIMDETGLLSEPYFTEGYHGLEQEDVRQFQLAKGALRAGIEVLCNRSEVVLKNVEHIFLAGGVGRYCRIKDLFTVGLLPQEFTGRVTIVGNSCIGGMLSWLKNKESMIYCKGNSINLAEEPEFEELYYRFMNFEKCRQ